MPQVPGGGLPSGFNSAAQQAESSACARTFSSLHLDATGSSVAAAPQHLPLAELEEVPSLAMAARGPQQAAPLGSPGPQDPDWLGRSAAANCPSIYETPLATLPGGAQLSRLPEAPGQLSFPQLGAPSPTSILGVAGSGTVQRLPVGLCEAGGKGLTPARLAMAVVDHMCPEPTRAPGKEGVQPSMGVLAFITLLQETEFMRGEELSVFSPELIRESASDREFADAMAPCFKIEMLSTVGRRTFKLPELFPGLEIEPHLAEKDFIVPPGRLSAGEGRRDAHALSKAQTWETMEQIRLATVAAANRLASSPGDSVAADALEIGFVGVGNRGKDSMLVFVEAEDSSRAWGLVVQSKQSLAAQQGYETVRGILRAMRSDLKDSHSLPTLHDEWLAWQNRESACDEFPESSPSDEDWDEAAWDQRVIYGYVSCDKLFTEQQEEIRKELMLRKHPWMRRVLIVSHNEQACWHSRTGALLRYIRAAAQKVKKVCDTLRYVLSHQTNLASASFLQMVKSSNLFAFFEFVCHVDMDLVLQTV